MGFIFPSFYVLSVICTLINIIWNSSWLTWRRLPSLHRCQQETRKVRPDSSLYLWYTEDCQKTSRSILIYGSMRRDALCWAVENIISYLFQKRSVLLIWQTENMVILSQLVQCLAILMVLAHTVQNNEHLLIFIKTFSEPILQALWTQVWIGKSSETFRLFVDLQFEYTNRYHSLWQHGQPGQAHERSDSGNNWWTLNINSSRHASQLSDFRDFIFLNMAQDEPWYDECRVVGCSKKGLWLFSTTSSPLY